MNGILYAMAILVIGCVLLVISSRNGGEKWKLLFEVLRDVGIAFVVAVVVTSAFEIYARTQDMMELAQAAYDRKMSDGISDRAWNEVKLQLLDKHLLRKNGDLRVKTERPKGLLPDQIILHAALSYDLVNVSDMTTEVSGKPIVTRHNLAYSSVPDLSIPRFDYIKSECPDKRDNVTLSEHELRRASQDGYRDLSSTA